MQWERGTVLAPCVTRVRQNGHGSVMLAGLAACSWPGRGGVMVVTRCAGSGCPCCMGRSLEDPEMLLAAPAPCGACCSTARSVQGNSGH